MRKSETCKREMQGEAAVPSPTDASIQPWCWSFTCRCEAHRHGSRVHVSRDNSAGDLARSNSKYQPHWCTYLSGEREEIKMRKSREEQRVVKMVGKSQGAAMKGFQVVLSLILLSFQEIQVKATETSSIHFVKEMGNDADSFARKEVWIKAKISREDPVSPPRPFDRISISSLKEMVCPSVEAGWNEKANKKSNIQGKDPKTQKRNQPGKGPEHLVPRRLGIKVAGSRCGGSQLVESIASGRERA